MSQGGQGEQSLSNGSQKKSYKTMQINTCDKKESMDLSMKSLKSETSKKKKKLYRRPPSIEDEFKSFTGIEKR